MVASAVWYGALTYVAATAIREFQQIAQLVQGINQVGLAFGAVMLTAGLVVWWRRRRRGRTEDNAGRD